MFRVLRKSGRPERDPLSRQAAWRVESASEMLAGQPMTGTKALAYLPIPVGRQGKSRAPKNCLSTLASWRTGKAGNEAQSRQLGYLHGIRFRGMRGPSRRFHGGDGGLVAVLDPSCRHADGYATAAGSYEQVQFEQVRSEIFRGADPSDKKLLEGRGSWSGHGLQRIRIRVGRRRRSQYIRCGQRRRPRGA